MFDSICSCFDDEETQDDYEADCGGRGNHLLVQLISEANLSKTKASSLGDNVTRQLLDLEKAGLACAEVSAFNQFKSEFNRLNKLLGSSKYSAPQTANKFASVVKGLGP